MQHILITAVRQGDIQQVASLLEIQRIPAYIVSEALIDAAAKGHILLVSLLLSDERCDPTYKDNRALNLASVAGYTNTVRLLIEHGAMPTDAAVRAAIGYMHDQTLAALLTNDCSIYMDKLV